MGYLMNALDRDLFLIMLKKNKKQKNTFTWLSSRSVEKSFLSSSKALWLSDKDFILCNESSSPKRSASLLKMSTGFNSITERMQILNKKQAAQHMMVMEPFGRGLV